MTGSMKKQCLSAKHRFSESFVHGIRKGKVTDNSQCEIHPYEQRFVVVQRATSFHSASFTNAFAIKKSIRGRFKGGKNTRSLKTKISFAGFFHRKLELGLKARCREIDAETLEKVRENVVDVDPRRVFLASESRESRPGRNLHCRVKLAG